MWTVELLVVGVMIAINSVFAAYEIALASVSEARLDLLVRQHRRGSAAALRMKRSMEASLAVVQLGITLVGVIAAATGGAGATELIRPSIEELGFSLAWSHIIALAIVTVPLTMVTIVVGELVPKVFALRNKEWVCLRLSPFMEWFSWSVWPAVWLFEKSVTLIMHWSERRWRPGQDVRSQPEEAALQELRAIAAIARMSRIIGLRQEGIIVNAARLSSTPVRAIMLPAEHIGMLWVGDSIGDSLLAAHHDMHTRFPVTQRAGDPQQIVGYVNFKDIVACLRLAPNEPSIRSIVRPLPTLDADAPVSACLEKLIQEHGHIALVRDESAKILGMITLEDILEELVGEIHDEYDRLPGHIVASGVSWVVGGGVPLDRLDDLTGLRLPVAEGTPPPITVNDWIVQTLKKPPTGGEVIQREGIRVLVRKVRRQLVLEAQITGPRRTAEPKPSE